MREFKQEIPWQSREKSYVRKDFQTRHLSRVSHQQTTQDRKLLPNFSLPQSQGIEHEQFSDVTQSYLICAVI